MESRGNKDIGIKGVQSIGSTLHWGPSPNQNAYKLTHSEYTLTNGQDFSQDFHTFGMYWDEKGLYTYVDNEDNKVLTINFQEKSFFDRALDGGLNFDINPWKYSTSNNPLASPFDQSFYLI